MNMIYEIPSEMSTRRERKRRERVQGILETAMTIVVEEGLERMTVHRLARELDLTVGALYRYFPSKDAIIAALERMAIVEVGQSLRDAAQEAKSGPRPDPPSAAALYDILVIAEAYRAFTLQSPSRFQLISQILATPTHVLTDDQAERVMRPMMDLLGWIAEYFETAVRGNALAPGNAMERTTLFWSGLRAMVQTRKLARMQPETMAYTHLYRQMAGTLLLGWGAAPETITIANHHLLSSERTSS